MIHVKFMKMPSDEEKLLPFDRLNINDFSIFSHNFVSNGWDLINLILNILPWCGCVREVLHNRGVISFGFQNVNEFFFCPQP